MSKHTPGPWTISEPWSGFSSIKGGNGELVFGLAAGSPDEKRPDSECEANARLIAAAPELLEAAHKALRLLDKGTTGWGVSRDLLRAAIAKAETVDQEGPKTRDRPHPRRSLPARDVPLRGVQGARVED